jgi:hypothetical protein
VKEQAAVSSGLNVEDLIKALRDEACAAEGEI